MFFKGFNIFVEGFGAIRIHTDGFGSISDGFGSIFGDGIFSENSDRFLDQFSDQFGSEVRARPPPNWGQVGRGRWSALEKYVF